jgi:glycosyltransferase involved in cell wall biosynthesis
VVKKIITIGYDARMFGDQFTGIGRYNYEVTKRLFARKKIKTSSLKKSDGGLSDRTSDVDVRWVIFLNEPEYSQFDFPEHVTKVCVDAPHYSLAEQTGFVKKIYQSKCDLVHFSHFNLPVLYRKPFTVTIHDTTLSFFPGEKTSFFQKMAYQLVMRNALFSAKKIITVSHNTAKDVKKIFKVKDKKIKPIWNGLTDDFRTITETEKNTIMTKYNLGKNYLFYCGVWREHKNIKRLLQSFLQLSLQFKDLQLVITGSPDTKLLDDFFAENHFPFDAFEGLQPISRKQRSFQKKIKPLGKVPFEDLVLLMGGAKSFVFPSLYEGFGLPLLEAMKAGVPVVSSNTSSLPEVGGDAAVYFDPNSVDDIVQKISTVLRLSPQDRLGMVRRGLDQTKKFSWDRCADEMWDVFIDQLV